MKAKIWILTVANSEAGTEPNLPMPFGTETEAEAEADNLMRAVWEAAPATDDGSTDLPYPGDWREAQRLLIAEWGYEHAQVEITAHEVEICASEFVAMLSALKRMVFLFAPGHTVDGTDTGPSIPDAGGAAIDAARAAIATAEGRHNG